MSLEPLKIDPASIVEAINLRDWPALMARCYFEAQYRDVPKDIRVVSAPRLIERLQSWVETFDGFTIKIIRVTAASDRACCEITIGGTHTNSLPVVDGVIPATNRQVEFPAVMVLSSRDEKLRELTLYYDMIALLDQLAVVD